MSRFSNYSTLHGNRRDVTCIILDAQDSNFLARHGCPLGAMVGAQGHVGEGGTELVLWQDASGEPLRSYDRAAGKLILGIPRGAVRLRTQAGDRQLSLRDNVSINHLRAIEREGRVLLVSTAQSTLGPCRKRRARSVRSHAMIIPPVQWAERSVATDKSQLMPVTAPHPALIVRNGDGVGLRLPDDIAASLSLGEGARVDVTATSDGRIIVTRSHRRFTIEELLAAMMPEREHILEDDAPRGEEMI